MRVVQVTDSARFERLTERERVLLRMIAEGLATKQIADRFQIRDDTVDKAISVILRKLDMSRRIWAAQAFLSYEKGSETSPPLSAPRSAGVEPDRVSDPNVSVVNGADDEREYQISSGSDAFDHGTAELGPGPVFPMGAERLQTFLSAYFEGRLSPDHPLGRVGTSAPSAGGDARTGRDGEDGGSSSQDRRDPDVPGNGGSTVAGDHKAGVGGWAFDFGGRIRRARGDPHALALLVTDIITIAAGLGFTLAAMLGALLIVLLILQRLVGH